tara:strand:- start:4566 stop:5642 length:1077 start_codon:yes stop_codon:yes gene_type:complete
VLGPEQINIASRPVVPLSAGFTNLYVAEKVAKHIGLKDNQIIRGVVVDKEGLLKVIINNKELDLAATRGLKAGDRIDFRVERGADGSLLRFLAILPPPPGAPSMHRTAIESGAASRLLSLLYRPQQASLQAQLLKPESLLALLSQHSTLLGSQRIPELLGSIANLSPQMIRSALLNSGLFTEYFLANKLPVRQDLKQVMRLLATDKTISDSAKLTFDSAADEIESFQLNGLQAQHNREVYYQFFIPFIDENPVNIEFERGALAADGTAPDWVINLHLESDDIGQIWLKTTVRSEAKIEMIVWAERPEMAQRIKRDSPQLTGNLAHFGLQLTKFNVLNMPRPTVDAALSSPGQVLDVRT